MNQAKSHYALVQDLLGKPYYINTNLGAKVGP